MLTLSCPRCCPRRIAGDVAESGVQGNQSSIFLVTDRSNSRVGCSAKVLIKDMTSVMSGILKRIEGLEREIFVELEAHCSRLKEKLLPLVPSLLHMQSTP